MLLSMPPLFQTLSNFRNTNYMAHVRLREDKKVCCAVEIGTWGTGFAFRDFARTIPTQYGTWTLTDAPKTLTEALVGVQPPHKLKSFGFQARDDLTRMTQEERDQVMHFKQFKMQLAGEGDRNWMVKDNEYPDRTINFKLLTTRCIEYVCGVAMTQISAQFSTVTPEQIQWVLTVPAIWDQAARRLMLDAAEDAGLFGVMIALEPEGASLAIRADLLDLQVGTTYLIVDAGSYSIDITAHKCTSDTEICELYPPSGGPWGSESITTGVISFLKDIFDPDGDVFPHIEKNDWYQLEDDLDTLMLLAHEGPTTMNFDTSVIYGALETLGKPEFATFVDSYNSSPKRSTPPIQVYREGSLRLPTCIFTNPIRQKALATISHIINRILPEITEPVKVFLVGGLSRSEIFRDIIKKELAPLPVSWPHFPLTAVMQGAVEFGINPMSINKRCAPYTYAVLTSDLAVNHPGKLAFWTEQGEKRCHVLKTFVKSKDIINIEEVIRHTFCPMTPQQESVAFTIYKSKKREITYPEENGVIMVKGGLTLNNVPNRGRPVSEREVVVTLNFGSTVIAVDVAHGSP
ncbi:heat shock 70 kDa protein, partial [Pelomyxa schiedti]